ncbi:MAG: tetratricopeptide repeat protein [Acidobacteria bacterium]|nr:tetratricopeptide repeat protein [Acidobacteriota bacterium]
MSSSESRVKVVGLLIGGTLALLASSPSSAQSAFAVELRTFATRYHENPARLDAIRDGLANAVRGNAHLEDLTALAQVSFIWGDIRATTPDQKLEAYEQGRQAAKRAVELDPKNVVAHFWYATNTARWGQTKGVVRSLFLLPTVNEETQIVLKLDPTFTAIYALAGNVAYEVPGLLGGDLNRAEQMFRKGLELDPKFTAMRVGLGKTLIKQGRIAEAQRELKAVLDEKEPRNLADWIMKDSKKARELLASIKGRS